MMKSLRLLSFALSLMISEFVPAQTGSEYEPVRYIGGEIDNPNLHDGGFRYAVGVENIQVMRANHTYPEESDGFGWTYNHAPNLTYWNGTFYLQYLSNPKDEQQPPGHTLIVTSKDGRNWSKPVVAFPEYHAPKEVQMPKGYTGYIMHQRMGFYTAPNGRLLTVAFYGHSYNPFKEGGIGRVVREIHKDGSWGNIYFIRYSSHAHWNASNTTYPFYKSCKDKGFIAACDALLKDPLRTLQWNDEDRGLDGFCHLKDSANTVEALSYYHRKDGAVVALWKKSFASLSYDGGMSWTKPRKMPTLIMAGGKNWGQRTQDGRYVMCYNPIATQPYRYPLIEISGDDGILFDEMGVIHGEVPPRRFYGENKDFGPCYVRGIVEGEEIPPGNDMWLAYSVNKEDIWVSRIPLPVRIACQDIVNDSFDAMTEEGPVPCWNLYCPKWAKVSVCNFPSAQNKSLKFEDTDPYDYARAIRVFQTSSHADISFKFYVEQSCDSTFQIDVTDRYGNRAVSLVLAGGLVQVTNGVKSTVVGKYIGKQWNKILLHICTTVKNGNSVTVNGKDYGSSIPLREAVKNVERISFRTGAYRCLPDRFTPNQVPCEPLPGCDVHSSQSVYYIDDVVITSSK